MQETGLVTVLFKSDNVLEGFFKSLAKQSYKDFHLYVIDNSPSLATDDLIAKLANDHQFFNFTHIKNESNVGVATGNNQGIKLSLDGGSRYTLLLNNDIEFDDVNLLANLLIQSKDEYLSIPKMLYYDTRKIWVAGARFIRYKGIIEHFGDGAESNSFNEEMYCEYAPTCFMLINNEVFKKIGLMDEKYFVYYDDTDFLYRAHVAGYKIKYIPSLVILHKVSSSTGGNESPFSVYYATRNRLYFIKKNFNGVLFLTAYTLTLGSRIVKWIFYKEQRSAIYKAVRDSFNM